MASAKWLNEISKTSKNGSVGLPFPRGVEARAAKSVPGTVGVPGQAAVGAGCTVGMATVQRHLGQAMFRAHI